MWAHWCRWCVKSGLGDCAYSSYKWCWSAIRNVVVCAKFVQVKWHVWHSYVAYNILPYRHGFSGNLSAWKSQLLLKFERRLCVNLPPPMCKITFPVAKSICGSSLIHRKSQSLKMREFFSLWMRIVILSLRFFKVIAIILKIKTKSSKQKH